MRPQPKPFRLKPGLELILASASPRRKELLSSLGLAFSVFRTDALEPPPLPGEEPGAYAARAASAKGLYACRKHGLKASSAMILAADTIVCIGGEILGKPGDPDKAFAMLEKLNGRVHQVFTAFYLAMPGNEAFSEELAVAQASVSFGKWPADTLRAYANCGEPLDKAGAYAIQGQGSFLVERLEGAWTTVVGLPLAPLAATMLRHGLIEPA